MTTEEKLQVLTESHARLMTESEIFWSRHKEFTAEQDREWERQRERWRQYEVQRQEDRERGLAMDRRIADLVSGIGELIRKNPTT